MGTNCRRLWHRVCNSATIVYVHSIDAMAAQVAFNGESLMHSDALAVTIVSGGDLACDDDKACFDESDGPHICSAR